MAKDILLKEMFIMLAVAIILLVLVNKIPPMVAGIVHGGGHFGGGGSGPMGGMGLSGVMGAAGVAGGIAATGAGNVAAQAAGGMSALQTAFKAAAQTVGQESSINLANQSSTSKLGGLANAMGQASAFASSFGAHLASGVADVAGNKKDAFKASLSDKVSKTAGGKVASSISAQMNSGGDALQAEPTTTSEAQSQSTQRARNDNVKDIKSSNGDMSGGVGEGDEINLPDDNKPISKEG